MLSWIYYILNRSPLQGVATTCCVDAGVAFHPLSSQLTIRFAQMYCHTVNLEHRTFTWTFTWKTTVCVLCETRSQL